MHTNTINITETNLILATDDGAQKNEKQFVQTYSELVLITNFYLS